MRGLALVGMIAIAFGLGSYYTTESLGGFAVTNLAGGAVALLAAAVAAGFRGAGRAGTPTGRRRLLPRAVWVVLALAAAVGLERCAQRTELRADWTAERRFELAPATRQALAELPGPVTATLYFEDFDPRVRRTRLLLDTLAENAAALSVRQRRLAESALEADRYEVTRSNSVVLVLNGSYETVENPTEGSLYEALRRLGRRSETLLYVARGEGEGDFASVEPIGYSGLGAALHAEGYRLRELVLAAANAIPEDAAGLLVVGPERHLRDAALIALADYLKRGGRLVVLLDPGRETGLEPLLGAWGFELPDAMVIDPASGPVEGDAPGLNPILFTYAEHPVVRGLDSRRMLFLLRARPVLPARKPAPQDELTGVAFSSGRAWLTGEVAAAERGLLPSPPPDATRQHFPLVAAGRYPRDPLEVRIVVFGDSDFASNRYLRALYNLDAVLNAVHWATQREESITLRPKTLTPHQFPLTPQDSLRMFYGVGLVIPEGCLIAAALIWLRRRAA